MNMNKRPVFETEKAFWNVCNWVLADPTNEDEPTKSGR
jgi:hypothetical protein